MTGDNAGTGSAAGGVTDGGVRDGVAVGVAVGVGAAPSHVQEVGLQVCPRAQRLLVHIGGPQPPVPPLHTQVLPDGTQIPNPSVPQVPAQEPHGPPGVVVGVTVGVAEGVPGASHMQVAGLHACGAAQEPLQEGTQTPPPSEQKHVVPAATHVPAFPQGPPQTPQNCALTRSAPTCSSNTSRSIA